MNKQKYLIKNVGILTISNFASKILVFLLVPLYTSVLSTSEYGTADLLVSTISIFTPLLTLNIVDAVMRFTMDEKYDKRDVFSAGEYFTIISIAIVFIFLLINHFGDFSLLIKKYELFIFFSYLFGTGNNLLTQFAKGLEKIKEMGIAGVIGTVSTISLNVFFLLVIKLGLNGYLFTMICASLIQFIYLFISLKIWKFHRFSIYPVVFTKEMLIYCVPLLATTIGWWINSAADRYVVTFLVGVSATGLVSVSYKIPQIINTLQSIFIQAWQISAIKEYGEQDTAIFYGKTFKVINFLMCAACSWLILLTRPLAHILYAKDFYVAWKFVPFLLISSVLNCASGLLGPILSAKKDSKSMMWSAIFGAIVNVGLNILLVFFMGIQGATISTAIASFIIYIIRKRAVGKDIIIDGYFIVIATWIGLCIQAIIEVYFKSYLLEIFIMFVLLCVNFNSFKNIVVSFGGLIKSIKKDNKIKNDK